MAKAGKKRADRILSLVMLMKGILSFPLVKQLALVRFTEMEAARDRGQAPSFSS